MENKINIAELLKDCPKGMELDCTICNGVKFIELDRNPNYPIVVRANNGYEFSLTKYGQVHNIDDAKCVIFPKGKNTWEGFVPPCKFKVGDKVTHNMGTLMNVVHMYWDAECNVVRYDIQSPVDNNYKLKAMLAEHLQPYKEETMEERYEKAVNHVYETEVISFDIAQRDKYELDLQGKFEVVLREGKYYVERIKPQYPKTYEECCKVIGYESDRQSVTGYLAELIEKFQQLLICRDAYLKIAGEQMGLGKSWNQDYDNRCFIITNTKGNINTYEYHGNDNVILAFPTEEIRDAFKENFDGDIDICKEFL